MFWIASPRPMLSEIFSTRGTAIGLSRPNSLASLGATSSLYRSRKRDR